MNQFAPANAASPAFPVPDITSNVGSILADGSTTIGGGLFLGAGQLPSVQSGRREVLLLMSDGKQNNDRGAGTDPATNKTATYPDVNSTACTGTNPCKDLTYPVYTVTVGTSTAVDPGIMRDIASHSGGFYINTEDNACLLRPFFLEMLQNFLWFNTYETLRMTSSAAPYTSTMPVAATSRDVEFHVMWQPEFGGLRLTVTPPGGAAPIAKEGASGFLSVVQPLPIAGAFDPLGDWKVQVDAPVGTTTLPRIYPI